MIGKKILKIFSVFDFRKTCAEYKVALWECPPFIFTLLGGIIIIAIVSTYFVGRAYASPEILALIVCIVTGVLMILSYVVLQVFERIARSSKEKSEFIGIMSHELRNPLSSIKWQLDLLLQKEISITGERGREAILAIDEQNSRMIQLVNDLLELNRLENNALVLMPLVFSLNLLVKETVAKYVQRAAFSGAEIGFSLPKEDVQVNADREKIGDVLSRLLDNAINYSSTGGKVNVALEKISGNRLRVSVSDEGVGIPEEEMGNIFQKFYRGGASRRFKGRGLGIGLYIVKLLIESFGGTVGFSSIEGRGSTFWFELPIK